MAQKHHTNSSTLPGTLGAKLLYYQCKTCSSFLSSSSKWATHLQTCSTTACVNGNLLQKSVGLRLVTFTQPKLILERVHWQQNNNERDGAKTNNCKTDEDYRSFGKPKIHIRIPGSKHVKMKSKIVQPINPAHKKRGRKPGIANFRRKKIHRKDKLKTKTKFKELQTRNSINDLIDQSTHGAKEKEVSNNNKYSRAAAIAKSIEFEDEEKTQQVVRRFHFRCHLCPGGFFNKFELDRHVNGVHFGARRLMTCCVCDRVFNKRDSLNDHILVHEKAEAYEDRYKFLQPWTSETKKGLTGIGHAFAYCKFCLLSHSTQYSYVTHIREEHSDNPETFQFSCKFDNCPEKFSSLRTMIDHAKHIHPQEYHGRLTWMRMSKGIFTGNLVMPRDEFGNYIKKQDQNVGQNAVQRKTKVQKTIKRIKKGKQLQVSKRVKSFTPFQEPLTDEDTSDDNAEDYDPNDYDWARKHRSSVRNITKTQHHPNPPVKIIELESVQIKSEGAHLPVIKSNPKLSCVKIEPMS